MRKPAYKASWSTRASPGVRAPQRPQAFTRPTAAPRPQPHGLTQSTSNNDCAPYPSQNKQSLSNNPRRPSQNTESQSVRANVAAYRPAQNIQTNISSWDSKDVQPTDDAAHKAKSELLRQYAAPQPQCHGKADFLRRVPTSAGNSTGSSGNSRASSNNSTVWSFLISSPIIRCGCERV